MSYPVVGTDMNSLMIGIGQRVGLGTMSKKTGGLLDPFISDVEEEHDRIITEALEQALLSGIQQQAASGAIPAMVLAKVMDLVGNDKMELAEAMNKVTEDAMKEAQAAQAAQGAPAAPSAEAQMAAGAGALSGSPIPGASQGSRISALSCPRSASR